MSQETKSSIGPMLLTFLAGAAAGAVLIALTTPKTGPELRGDLKDMARRAKRKIGGLGEEACSGWEDLKDRTTMAAGDLKRGVTEAAQEFRG
jgi:gas vesicle protein